MSAAARSDKVEAICANSEAKAARAGRKLGRSSAAAGDSEQELALPKLEGGEQDASRFVASMRNPSANAS